MNWLILALLSAALAALINHIDKYLIEKYLKGIGIGSLVIFSSLIGLPVFLLIALFESDVLNVTFKTAMLIIFNGMIYISWLLPYFYALQEDETSVVAPLFQLIPIFSLVLGYFILGETITSLQILASFLILLGSVGLTLEFSPEKNIGFKKKVYFLMALSSMLIAGNGVIFKYFAIQESFWVTSFWEYVGFFISAVLLFIFVSSYRQQFVSVLRLNKISILSINLLNELLAMLAKIFLNYASLLTSVALVFFVADGLTPLFVMIFGILLTIFFPKISKERLEKAYLIRKINAIILMILGVYLLQ